MKILLKAGILCTVLFLQYAVAEGENCDAVGGCAEPWASVGAVDGNATNYSENLNPFMGRNENVSYKIHLGDDMNDDREDGTDTNKDLGDKVFALADGAITYSGYSRGFGQLVILEHTRKNGARFCSQYAHMQYPTTLHEDPASNYTRYPRGTLNDDIDVGKNVVKGDWIGRVSGTRDENRKWGVHLHVEIRHDYPTCKTEPGSSYIQNTSGTSTSWGNITDAEMQEINDRLDCAPQIFPDRPVTLV